MSLTHRLLGWRLFRGSRLCTHLTHPFTFSSRFAASCFLFSFIPPRAPIGVYVECVASLGTSIGSGMAGTLFGAFPMMYPYTNTIDRDLQEFLGNHSESHPSHDDAQP